MEACVRMCVSSLDDSNSQPAWQETERRFDGLNKDTSVPQLRRDNGTRSASSSKACDDTAGIRTGDKPASQRRPEPPEPHDETSSAAACFTLSCCFSIRWGQQQKTSEQVQLDWSALASSSRCIPEFCREGGWCSCSARWGIILNEHKWGVKRAF